MGVWSKLKGAFGGVTEAPSSSAGSRFVCSRNLQLKVAAPVGAGWELAEAEPSGPLRAGFRASRDEGALVLHAKLFALEGEQQRSAEDLQREDWRGQWLATTFSAIETISVLLVDHMIDGFREAACEVRVTGVPRAGASPLIVRERQLPRAAQLLVLTAAAPAQLFERHEGAIEAWLANSTCGG
jgi:hypothetical protein